MNIESQQQNSFEIATNAGNQAVNILKSTKALLNLNTPAYSAIFWDPPKEPEIVKLKDEWDASIDDISLIKAAAYVGKYKNVINNEAKNSTLSDFLNSSDTYQKLIKGENKTTIQAINNKLEKEFTRLPEGKTSAQATNN